MGASIRACVVLALLLLPPPVARAQSGAATAKLAGQVSAAVSLSVSEASTPGSRAQTSLEKIDSTTTAVTISGPGREEGRVTLRLRLRSNAGYSLRATPSSSGALALRLSLADIKTTGRFVHANALAGIKFGETLAASQGASPPPFEVQDRPSPLLLLSGPAISRAGTFTSPDNAVELTLGVEIQPPAAGAPWTTRLTISAAPRP